MEKQYGVKVVAYLDDFLIIAEGKTECGEALAILVQVFKEIRI